MLEQNLAQVASGGGGAEGQPGGVSAEPALPPAEPDSPLMALLSGELSTEQVPLTDGLSVGPGRGAPEQPVWADDFTERLRFVAQFAKTPQLRAQARAALRYRVRGRDLQ